MPALKLAGRLLIAAVFLWSGSSKLGWPLENFEEVLRAYEVFPEFSIFFLSRFVPLAEFAMGLALALGLLTRPALLGSSVFFGTFIVVLSRALLLRLPITDCGCFGKGIAMPLGATLGADVCFFILALCLLFAKPSPFRLESWIFKR